MDVLGCAVVAKQGKRYLSEADIEARVYDQPEYPGFWWRETVGGPYHVVLLGEVQGDPRRRWNMEVVGNSFDAVKKALRRFGLTSSIRVHEIEVNPSR